MPGIDVMADNPAANQAEAVKILLDLYTFFVRAAVDAQTREVRFTVDRCLELARLCDVVARDIIAKELR
jgi:hypothetical protein